MRHGKKFNHLGRTAPHRKAMLSNMAASLILHKRINTTVAKAKALRVYIEPLLTKAKDDTTASRRVVFSYLQARYGKYDKNKKDDSRFAVEELFNIVAPKIASRNGGYTRIIKTGFRLGDGADTALIELVDFNELYNAGEVKKTTRRSRRPSKKTELNAETEVKEEVKAAEETVAEAPQTEAPKAETSVPVEEKTTSEEEETKE